ncbi:hypothetical protein AAHA92_09036 [Salvia divinorum]|uniref:Uncharacterized protein n=1 Tax=Salvia divinorum TaxID=28513 RepID=A0ABD1HSS3_SALDI
MREKQLQVQENGSDMDPRNQEFGHLHHGCHRPGPRPPPLYAGSLHPAQHLARRLCTEAPARPTTAPPRRSPRSPPYCSIPIVREPADASSSVERGTVAVSRPFRVATDQCRCSATASRLVTGKLEKSRAPSPPLPLPVVNNSVLRRLTVLAQLGFAEVIGASTPARVALYAHRAVAALASTVRSAQPRAAASFTPSTPVTAKHRGAAPSTRGRARPFCGSFPDLEARYDPHTLVKNSSSRFLATCLYSKFVKILAGGAGEDIYCCRADLLPLGRHRAPPPQKLW